MACQDLSFCQFQKGWEEAEIGAEECLPWRWHKMYDDVKSVEGGTSSLGDPTEALQAQPSASQ